MECLRSLAGGAAEVFVVDNASEDGSAEAVRALRPEVTLIANAANEGFARANNQALRLAQGRYVCLLNPDTEVQPGALGRLQAALDRDPQLGIVGPRLLNPDGSLQSAGLRFPSRADLAGGAIPWGRPARRPRRRHAARESVAECDWLLGACMMIRREVLEQVGLLDEAYFMYGEEKDLCYRAKQAGWRVACVPEAEVVHHGGQSADQAPVQSYLAFLDSQFHFLGKFYPPEHRRLFARANWLGCRLRQAGAAVLARLQPSRREAWRNKGELARAGARRCAEYLRRQS
jgi:GT2 family glycosyltransferase